ncbi:DedA family protein [Actinoplanes sp. NPDC051494]|uniref:DedA family protein n=1 Tax=Actinoplanes sp. NPDC051494 TaxID=3363907 RepID=UPI0037B81873
MLETLLETLLPTASSPWLYLIVFLMVAIDGFLPVVPSEATVIGLSALSATGSPNLVALATAVTAGGVAGDQISYLLGRRAGSRVTTGKLAAARAKAEHALLRYGAAAILAGRFLPCGRAATTWTSGSVSLPLGRFRLFSALASMAWAGYMIGLGWLGGSAFADMPLLGAAIGLAIGAVLAGAHSLIEKRRATYGSSTPNLARAGDGGHGDATVIPCRIQPEGSWGTPAVRPGYFAPTGAMVS